MVDRVSTSLHRMWGHSPIPEGEEMPEVQAGSYQGV